MHHWESLFFFNGYRVDRNKLIPTLNEEKEKCNSRARNLLRDVYIQESGTINKVTTRDAHLTAQALDDAYCAEWRKRRQRREA